MDVDATANTARLRDWVNRRHGLDLKDYEDLRQWSVRDLPAFWGDLWDYFELQSPTPYRSVLADHRMPGARWFEGAQVNYVQQLLRHVDAGERTLEPAVVFRNERLQAEGRSIELGWAELARQSAAFASALQVMGVKRGDRVAAYLPNVPQALVAFLACASLGAIWSLCAPDMGAGTVADRFKQIEPKVLIACDGTVYGGKTIDRRELVAALVQQLTSVEALVTVPCLELASGQPATPMATPDTWRGKIVGWAECLQHDGLASPEWVPFDHPLWIVYSSGTTGLPKPIVHGHGGVMLEVLKLLSFHLNLGATPQTGDRFHWYSSTAWVMWNLQVSALLLGTTVCLYDGHPSYPQADTLWRYASDVSATFLGAGAAYYTSCMKAGLDPRRAGLTSKLRALGSTGSPLPAEAYRWGDEHVRPGIWWAVISGGTDLASAFLGGTPELPTVPGEMQARCLGADVHAWNEAGQPVIDDVGELVCTQPMPSMPLMFWGDNDDLEPPGGEAAHPPGGSAAASGRPSAGRGRRYHDSYFDVFPNVWRHGDWLRITPEGGCIVYGRSDATLNRHGHRLGTSEIYRAVEALPGVLDSLVVDIEVLGRPSYMPLFVVLRPGLTLDDALREDLKRRIRDGVSPRFVPDEILQVPEIPRTPTGKKQELPVKKLLLGKPLAQVVNPDACANAAAFEYFVAFARKHEAGKPHQSGVKT